MENKDNQASEQGIESGELIVTDSLKEAVENAWMVIEAVPE
jgi:hypothetical protein